MHPEGKFRPNISKLISMDSSPSARGIPINLKTVVKLLDGGRPYVET